MSVNPELRKHGDPRQAIEADRNQLWAEAVQRYKDGEKLYLGEALEAEARKVNKVLDDLGWQKRPTLTFPIYGKQRAFVRPIEEDDSDL